MRVPNPAAGMMTKTFISGSAVYLPRGAEYNLGSSGKSGYLPCAPRLPQAPACPIAAPKQSVGRPQKYSKKISDRGNSYYTWRLRSSTAPQSGAQEGNMRRIGITTLVLLVCLVASCGIATATNIISSNTGLTSPASTITFSEIILPDNTPLTNQYAGLGVTFSGGYYYNGCPTCVDPPPNGSHPQISDFPGTSTDMGSLLTTISLNSPVNGIAFN